MFRTAIVTILLSLCTAANAGAEELNWQFEVLLDEKPIGHHTFRVSHGNRDTQVLSEAEFKVKVLFATLFSYEHRSSEVWSGDCVMTVDARTRTRGETINTKAAARNAQLRVKSNDTSRAYATECAKTFAYWNPKFLDEGRLLNPQTGDYEPVSIRRLGSSSVDTPQGAREADLYEIRTGTDVIRVWYDKITKVWLSLESDLENGRTLQYRPLNIPTAGPSGEQA